MADQQTYGSVSHCSVASEVLKMLLASLVGCSKSWKFSPLQISFCFSSSAETATMDFGITQLVVAMGLLIVTQLHTGWTNREELQRKLYLMLQKSFFVVTKSSMLL